MIIILGMTKHSLIRVPEAEGFATKSQIQFRGKGWLFVTNKRQQTQNSTQNS